MGTGEGWRGSCRCWPLGMLRHMSATSNIIHDCDEVFNYREPLHFLLYRSKFHTWEYRFLYPVYRLSVFLARLSPRAFLNFLRQNTKQVSMTLLLMCLSLTNILTDPWIWRSIEVYKILEHHDDVANGFFCVGSEWHRFPSSFFVPDFIRQVRWIDDGFDGLLPFPFNSTLGWTSAAPPYFIDKSKLHDLDACTFLVELQLSCHYPTRGTDLSKWEPIAALPYLDRNSPHPYAGLFSFHIYGMKRLFRNVQAA